MRTGKQGSAPSATNTWSATREDDHSHLDSTTHGGDSQGLVLACHKRGKTCIIGKLVTAQPLGEKVIAIAYKSRMLPAVVSLPVVAVRYAQAQGVRLWVVRDDTNGLCFSISLSVLKATGWLQTSFGLPEYFIPVSKFQHIAWQDWAFAKKTISLDAEAQSQPALQAVLL